MTIEVRQMVIRSELGNGPDAATPSSQPRQEPDNCCAEDEDASNRHRQQRAQMRELRAQMAMLRER